MTLGRTSSGAIKIKTDSPGLRAVECACCGGCGCYSAPVSGDLLTALQNINSVTCNGQPPDFENNQSTEGFYYGVWDFGIEGRFISYQVQILGECLSISGQTLSYSTFEFDGFRYIGPLDGCCPSGQSCSASGDISVNGIAIPSYIAGVEFPIYEFVFL